MAWWSATLWSRFALTTDAATYLQAMFLISHGHLDPTQTLANYAAIKDHFSLFMWPISLLDLPWPHGLILLWAQDAALAAEIVAFAWIRHIVRDHRPAIGRNLAVALLIAGLMVLVLDPWTYWASSFDIHLEAFACPFVVAAAFDFSRGRNTRAWCWVVALLSFGDVAVTWIVGLAISALVAAYFQRGRHHVRTAAFLAGVGLVWLELIGLIGANNGGIEFTDLYGYLVGPAGVGPGQKASAGQILFGLISHPARAMHALGSHSGNILANLAPTGVVGIFTPWTIGVPVVVLLVNNVAYPSSQNFAIPGFQSIAMYNFGAVGLVILGGWVATRLAHQGVRVVRVALALAVANVAVWGAIWVPALDARWLPGNSFSGRSVAAGPAADTPTRRGGRLPGNCGPIRRPRRY
jgi:hypothetical protein